MTDDGIFRFLVRYGKQGQVGLFGTVHELSLSRGADVVLDTARGREWGVLLSDANTSTEGPLIGEVIRAVNETDIATRNQLPQDDEPLLEEATRRLQQTPAPDVVVDVEYLLDESTIVLYHLHDPTLYLGQISSALAELRPGFRVQFEQVPSEMLGGEVDTQDAAASVESLHPEEKLKRSSDRLLGQILDESRNENPRYSKSTVPILKMHGIYQQKIRNLSSGNSGTTYQFMIRVKLAGGKLTAGQLLTLMDLADEWGDGSLRLTARQCIQFHGVTKRDLQPLLRAMDATLTSADGACGDLVRNIMACPLPDAGLTAGLRRFCDELHAQFQPASHSYFDLWIDGERKSEPEPEPIYGDTMLPRKFKIALAVPDDNCVDLLAQDLGLLADIRNGAVRGFNAYVGGGQAIDLKDPDSRPQLAQPLAFIPTEQLFPFTQALVEWYRDHGPRDQRRRARLRYLVDERGVDAIRGELEGYLDDALSVADPALRIQAARRHTGWLGDDHQHFGMRIAGGRIAKDSSAMRLLRQVLSHGRNPVRVTPRHDLILLNLSDQQRRMVMDGLEASPELGDQPLTTMACPALPTCGLAVGEAERWLPEVSARLQNLLEEYSCSKLKQLDLRIAGCGNSCSRTWFAEVGLLARGQGKYDLLLGGDPQGRQLARRVREDASLEDIYQDLRERLLAFQQSEALSLSAFIAELQPKSL